MHLKFCDVILCVVGATVWVLTGCAEVPTSESQLPWAKPASWEGKNPTLEALQR